MKWSFFGFFKQIIEPIVFFCACLLLCFINNDDMRPVYYHFFCPCSLFFVVGTYKRSLLLKISMIRSTRTFKGPLLHPYTKPNTINIDKNSLTKLLIKRATSLQLYMQHTNSIGRPFSSKVIMQTFGSSFFTCSLKLTKIFFLPKWTKLISS